MDYKVCMLIYANLQKKIVVPPSGSGHVPTTHMLADLIDEQDIAAMVDGGAADDDNGE